MYGGEVAVFAERAGPNVRFGVFLKALLSCF